MSTIQQLIASAVEQHFSEPFGTGGFVPFVAATDGLTGQQAAAVPAERLNSVWAVVNHLIYSQDGFCRGLLGELTEQPSMEQGWPPLGEINDANWQAARQKALDSNHRLAEVIGALKDTQLEETVPLLWNLETKQIILAIDAHLSYHTAEIVTIRHMQGLWVEHQFA